VYPKKDTTHTLIANKLTVALRARSSVWQCRYNVDGKWQRTSTGERDLEAAKARAHQLLIEANVRKQLNAAPVTRKFKDIANLAIRRMTDEDAPIILGALGALLAIFLKEAVQQALLRRARAWQLFGYLFSLKKSIVRNGHLFAVYVKLEERHNKLMLALSEGTEAFKNQRETASKERTKFREELKVTILAALEKTERIEFRETHLALVSFASDSLALRRELLIN